MGAQRWEVVGGADKGGIVVRAGRDLASEQLPEKLATAALVEQLERVGDRLRYRLVGGRGPEEGWVSVRLKDKVLLEPRSGAGGEAAPAAAAAHAPPAGPEPSQADGKVEPVDDFEQRLEDLRERYPGFVDPMPDDARGWAPQDLDNYFESGGFIKPRRAAQAKAPPRGSPPGSPPGDVAEGEAPQLATAEVQRLQEQLRDSFKAKSFQERLSRLQRAHPKRKERGHSDGTRFFEAFEALVLTVFCKVLPKYGLQGDWDGVRDMHARMASALVQPKVRRQQEEINLLLGLPREAVLRPAKRAEDAFIFRPGRDGGVPGPPLPLLADGDGDEAHEFLVEDPATGELHSALGPPGCGPLPLRRAGAL